MKIKNLINQFVKFAYFNEKIDEEKLLFGIDLFFKSIDINLPSISFKETKRYMNFIESGGLPYGSHSSIIVNIKKNYNKKIASYYFKDPKKIIIASDNLNIDVSKKRNLITIYEFLKQQITNYFNDTFENENLKFSIENYNEKIKEKFADDENAKKAALISFVGFIDVYAQQFGNEYVKNVIELSGQSPFDDSKIVEYENEKIVDKYRDLEDTCHSCMTTRPNLTKLYANNPDKVKLITYKDCRFLFWKCDDGVNVLDRIYPSGHNLSIIIKAWARKHGILTRKIIDQMSIGEKLSDDSTRYVTLSLKGISQMPYIDTFCFGKINTKDKTITLTNTKEPGFDFIFLDQHGEFRYEGREYSNISKFINEAGTNICKDCGGTIEKDDDFYQIDDEFLCEDCFTNNSYTICNECNKAIDIEDRDSFSTYDDEYYCYDCFSANFTQCDNYKYNLIHKRRQRCENYTKKDRAHQIDRNDYICDDCMEDFVRCEECGNLISIENSYTDSNGEYSYCEGCFDIKFTRCEKCGDTVDKDDAKEFEDLSYCESCFDDLFAKCPDCNKYIEISISNEIENTDGDDVPYCDDCYEKRMKENSK